MIKSKISSGDVVQVQYKQYQHCIKKYQIYFDPAPFFFPLGWEGTD